MDEIQSRKTKKFLFLLLFSTLNFGFFLLPAGRANGQILDQIRSQARAIDPSPDPKSKPEESVHDHHHSHDHSKSENNSNFLGELLGAMLFGNSAQAHRSASADPASQLIDNDSDIQYELFADTSQQSEALFLKYPYQIDDGILIDSTVNDLSGLSRSSLQSKFWFGSDFDNLKSWNGQFRYDSVGSFGSDLHWAHLREKQPNGRTDTLNLIDLNLTTNWIQTESLILRGGAGINILSDRIGTHLDYNLTLSIDFFPHRPWILSFEVDHGELGSVHQTHLLSQLGIQWKHAELLTGYEYRQIGRSRIGGPLLGLRFWF